MTPIRTKQLQSVWSKSNESQTKKLRQKLYRNYTGIIQGEVFMQILDSRMTIVVKGNFNSPFQYLSKVTVRSRL